MSGEIVFKKDRFDGILIDISKQVIPLDTFAEKLKDRMIAWGDQGKRGLWVTIQIEHACLIPQLVQIGLDFHHAKPGYVCMTKWLAQNIPNHLPEYANHNVGAAGFVVNANNQILAIQESFHVKNKIFMWKLPGGAVDTGEEFPQAATREVYEETGVPVEFVCVLGYRHLHNFRHGCSDIYIVCLMRPLALEIKACPQEIADCKWMDLDEYESSGISVINRYFVQLYREYIKTGIAIGVKDITAFNNTSTNKVYSACCVRDIAGNAEIDDAGEQVDSSQIEDNDLVPV